MILSIIVASADNGVIGRDGGLPWRLPADLRRFKRLTLGHHLLMGRRTFESVGRPLPGRTTVVITRRPDWRVEGVTVARSFREATSVARRAGEDEAFVAGGAQVYREALSSADRIYWTRVRGVFPGDTFFPEPDLTRWELVEEEDHEADEANPHPFRFLFYERRG